LKHTKQQPRSVNLTIYTTCIAFNKLAYEEIIDVSDYCSYSFWNKILSAPYLI